MNLKHSAEEEGNEKENAQIAQVLSEALPYFKRFRGKKILIKIGGSVLAEENIDQGLIKDIVLLKLVGIEPIIVHGGGNHISKVMNRFHKEAKFIDGLRVTDKETLEITQMVLGGIVNQKIVSLIHHFGSKAVGLSGKDGALIIAEKLKSPDYDLGYVGKIVSVNSHILEYFNKTDYIPVISPIGTDKDYAATFNINADNVATEIAISMQCEKLIFISDQLGVLKNVKDASTLMSEVRAQEIPTMKKDKVIEGGMIPKLDSAAFAIKNGVEKVHLISGKIKNSLLMELFTAKGIGTQVF